MKKKTKESLLELWIILSFPIGVLIGSNIYVVETFFSKDNTDITLPQIDAMLNKWKVSYCRVESNSMGAMFARTLQRSTKARILQITNQTNKITRIIMQSAFIKSQFIFVNRSTPGYLQFMENVYSFSKEGKNKNDDAPDCLAGLSMFAQGMFKNLFNSWAA